VRLHDPTLIRRRASYRSRRWCKPGGRDLSERNLRYDLVEYIPSAFVLFSLILFCKLRDTQKMNLPLFHNCIRKVCTLVAATLILPTLAYADNNRGDDLFSNNGLSYLITLTDAATGAFVARSVLTFHADHTMSAILSGQGGPTFQFSSQLGSWKFGHAGGLVARTIFFEFPSFGLARLDYTATFASDRTQVTGTITLTDFHSLTADPFDGNGILAGHFNFTGTLVTP
jgi:hypothetical protein